MASIPNIVGDSYRPLLLEVIFLSKGGKQALPLQLDFVESMTVQIKREGAATGSLVLFDRSGDFLLGLIAAAGNDRRILLRWGWDDGRGLELYPQYVFHYVTFIPEFSAQGTRVTFDLVARSAYEQALDRRTRTFKATTKISDIVREIALDRGWKIVDARGRATIEETTSVLTEDLVQRGESDFAFIIGRVKPRAVNAKKQGNYRFWFPDDDKVIRFHTDEFLPGGRLELRATYRFAQDQMGEVISFAPADLKFFSVLHGGGASVFWGIDSLKGTRIRLASTDIGGLPDTQEVVDAEGGFITKVLPKAVVDTGRAIVNAFWGMVSRTEEDFESRVRTKFDQVRRLAYQATLDVLGTHALLPTDRVKVEYLTSEKQEPHFLSGTFFVNTVEHEVSGGGWHTSMDLHRLSVSETGELEEIPAALKQRAKETPATQGGGKANPRSSAGQKAATRSKERRGARLGN